jgi:hypothetical protein
MYGCAARMCSGRTLVYNHCTNVAACSGYRSLSSVPWCECASLSRVLRLAQDKVA